MRRKIAFALMVVLALPMIGASACLDEQVAQERRKVSSQQVQYSIAQPMPLFDWSLERQLIIDLYRLRNEKVSTHAVWRSDYGTIEGDCPSMGFGLPYDTSLTNPLRAIHDYHDSAVVEQPEPNGIFASKNTAATWVMCIGDGGLIEPVYIESKVTIYPGPVKVDYANNRVTRSGAAAVRLSVSLDK